MAFRHNKSIGKLEYTVGTLPPSKVFTCPPDDSSIPPNLADLTNLIIQAHKVNGDLAWLADMVGEAEAITEPESL